MLNEQKYFSELLSLTGQEIELGLASSGKSIRGEVVNVMFDSFILKSNSETSIIRFEDITYLHSCASE